MTSRPALIYLLAAVVTAVPAWAQPVEPDPPADPVDPPLDPDRVPGVDDTSVGIIQAGIAAPVNVVEGDGIKIGEGTALYPTVGLDTGFVSNVFFEESSTSSAGVLRLTAGIGTGSLSGRRLVPRSGGTANPGDVQHRADLRLTYDFYLSGNRYVSEQNGLGIAATVRGILRPQQTWSFLYLDTFERIIRAVNFEQMHQVNRDINRLYLGVQYAPRGRSIRGLLHYSNTLDLFESSDHRFANRMQNVIGVTAAWRFRPYTVLFGDVSQGFFWGIGDATAYANAKVDSYPLTVMTGIQTLLTLKTTFIARVGYTNGFYSTGPSYSMATGGVEMGWRYSPLGRVSALYDYRFEDSINANYFRDHRIAMRIEQMYVPFALSLEPELMFRRYEGITTLIPTAPDTRDDFIFGFSAAARYNFRNTLAAVLLYRFGMVQTDFRYMSDGDVDDPSYLRHELVVGVRAAL